MLLECLRHIDNKDFGAVIFRREAAQITNEGGLWDNALDMYVPIGGIPKGTPKLCFTFPSGAKISFAHLHREVDVNSYQGAQICLIAFDELCHFEEKQFFYMLSRNRSTCGVKPYVRATCNPDSDSWVASFISWWIDQGTGYAIKERSGQLRYFVRLGDQIKWGDSREELMTDPDVSSAMNELADKTKNNDPGAFIKSVTFIASSIYDNKELLSANPQYLGNLKALSTVDRERLLNGNWKIRPAAGLYFKREQVKIVKSVPDKIVSITRAWDLAATEISEANKDPDRTASALIARMANGQYIVLDVIQQAISASAVRHVVVNTARTDYAQYQCNHILIPQDPGQAGKEQAGSYTRMLAAYKIECHPVSGDKIVRAEPFAAQWQSGNVLLLEGLWNNKYLDELEGFPEALHDDQVDASSDAFNDVAYERPPIIAETSTTNYNELLNPDFEDRWDGGY